VLLHLVDGTGEDLAGAYRTLRAELEAYGAGLAGKAEILVLNKIDALDEELAEAQAVELAEAAGCGPGEILRISGATGAGVPELLRVLAGHIVAWREAQGVQPSATGSAEVQPWEEVSR
jgi:GTP-binding protein